MTKSRTAVLHFVLWFAIFRTVLNHWYLLSRVGKLRLGGDKLRSAFAVSSGAIDYQRRFLQQTQGPPARFLMGIFTVQDKTRLRDAVRRTLNWYNDSRVCAIGSIDGEMPPQPPDHCQIIYTFVMGANPNGTSQFFADSSSDLSILTTPPKTLKAGEPNDITFLNIKVHFFND
jgi:hypothetical protein